jgi:membrane associated rhomboid family serine protease
LSRPGTKERRAATHPIASALVIGTFFWAIMFLNVLWAIGGTDLSAAQTAVGALVVGAIAGPTIALALRRRVRRGEAAA